MRVVGTQDFRSLEVINLCGGERLGYPSELEIDIDSAKVISFTVNLQDAGFSIFAPKEEYVIPWCKIDCIGEDAILVRLSEGELCACLRSKNRKNLKRL